MFASAGVRTDLGLIVAGWVIRASARQTTAMKIQLKKRKWLHPLLQISRIRCGARSNRWLSDCCDCTPRERRLFVARVTRMTLCFRRPP